MSEPKTLPPIDPPKTTMDDIINDLFHDAQNCIHRLGMELELINMGLGESSDAVKITEMIKSLENHVRDLRAYISSMQSPSATCDPAAVLEAVVANLQIGRKPRVHISWLAPQSLPLVALPKKLLARVLERVLDFCENLLQEGGELRIAASPLGGTGTSAVEFMLTLLTATPMTIQADNELFGESSSLVPINRGAKRALEVLRRHHGEVSFRKAGDRQCEISLRVPAPPQ